jgi:hypothetical protein
MNKLFLSLLPALFIACASAPTGASPVAKHHDPPREITFWLDGQKKTVTTSEGFWLFYANGSSRNVTEGEYHLAQVPER